MTSASFSITLFPFQEKVVAKLLDLANERAGKRRVVVKSPTGSGKTILLIDFIDKYLTDVSDETAFVWLCPGKGNLEEQSREKMRKFAPLRPTQDLSEALTAGFGRGTTTFVNWELVTKKDAIALRDGERKNLPDRIADARRDGIEFVVIVDEEHSNDTAKAQNVIDAFAAELVVRVSATAVKNPRYKFIEIDELDVIDAGLITKAVRVNEGLPDGAEIGADYDCLLELADRKRREIAERYRELGKAIRPLTLIQFPNAEPETVEAVEKKLSEMGYTYENGAVCCWMDSQKKGRLDGVERNDAEPAFLLMKQAISAGWDCPRAKILVKLRERMTETFEIQTIGRIRRTPERKRYDDDLLDFCFVYTLDEKYKAGLLSSLDKAYETRRLFRKKKCAAFRLTKEIRDLDFDERGERETLIALRDALSRKYETTGDKAKNRFRFQAAGYRFDAEIFGRTLRGEFARSGAMSDLRADDPAFVSYRKRADASDAGLRRRRCVDTIKATIGTTYESCAEILKRLFCKDSAGNYRLLDLSADEFLAFVVNNERKLRDDFRDATAEIVAQQSLLAFRKTTFQIPEQDFYRYDSGVKNEKEFGSNAFNDYTSGFATSVVRSVCEGLFERYCETRDDVDWVYKNGDSGSRYFSIGYVDGLGGRQLFYVDYIVKKTSGDIWILETKGGESRGQDKNVDVQIGNKFDALKKFAQDVGVRWGFVRDKDGELFLNNEAFAENVNDERWKPIGDVF